MIKKITYLLVALVAIVGIIIFIIEKYGFNTKQLIFEKVVDTYNYELQDSYVVFDEDLVLKVNKQNVQCMQISRVFDKNISWKHDYFMTYPLHTKNQKLVCVFDKLGYNVVMFNKNGKVYEVKTSSPIISVSINSSGYAAVLQKQEERSIISIYDDSGNKMLDRISFQTNEGVPISVAISDNNEMFVASYLDVSKNYINSKVVFFKIQGKELKDNIYASYEYEDTIITELKYINRNEIVGVGDDKLIKINVFSNEVHHIDLQDKIKDVFLGFEDTIVLFFEKEFSQLSDESTSVVFYNNNLKKKREQIVYNDIDNIISNNNTLIIGKGKDYYAYTKQGVLKWKFSFNTETKQVIPFNKSNLVLVITNKDVELFKVQTSSIVLKN